MPLRPARVGRVGVVGAPVAKTAVVAKVVSPGPSPVAKTAVVATAVTPGRAVAGGSSAQPSAPTHTSARGSGTLPDAHLSPETLLQLAPGVRTRFDAAGHVLLDAPDGTVVDLGPRGYATLSLFARPLALGDAIDRVERQAPSTDFAPTVNILNVLIEEGALVRPDASGDRQVAGPTRSNTPGCCTTIAGRATISPRSGRRYDRETWCSTSAPAVVCSRSPRLGWARAASTRWRPATSPRLPGGFLPPTGWTDTVTLVPGWSRADRAA